MRSAFFGFHVASTALHTSRALQNVTAHNIANVEIPGFSRQVGIARANQPLDLRDGRGMYGTGSRVTSVIQMRDSFLDRMFWNQRAVHGQFTSVNQHLTFVETIFNNLPGSGVLSNFNHFFSRVYDAAARSDDPTFRTGVITEAESLTEIIRLDAHSLQRQQRDVNREVYDTVVIINSLGTQITNLNEQIAFFERDGSHANDLRDQRALLIDELSHLVNVDVEERDFSTPMSPNDRRLSILINGADFINHTRLNTLETVARTSAQQRNAMDVVGLYDIRFSNGSAFNIFSPSLGGKLRGLIDVRDGNGGQATMDVAGTPVTTPRFKGIPFYMNQLNELVRTFARAMNEGRNVANEQIPGAPGHMNGFNADGRNLQTLLFTWSGDNSPTDINSFNATNRLRLYQNPITNEIFAAQPGQIVDPAWRVRDSVNNPVYTIDYNQLNAFNFIVNPDILADQRLLAASGDAMQGEAGNGVILGFNIVNQDRSLFKEGRLVDFIIAKNDHLAVDNRQAGNFSRAYEEITMQTHNHRLSIKGVNIDEEMLNLVRFQSMFIAASRLVNVIDTIYDTLINRLGNF